MRKALALALLFFVGLQACETDFEVNAPWKDITVVYGLLNQNEKPHIIKINKAFLGEADVNDMAQVPDSSEYAADEITAVIEVTANGTWVDQYDLTRYENSNKPAGTFYSPDQALYQFSDTLKPGYDYKLIVTKTATGEQVFAETQIIQDFKFAETSYWNAASPKVSFFNNGFYQTFDHAIWNTAVNGRRYQLTVRFYYVEVDNATSASTEKYLDWVFPSVQAADIDGGDELGTEIDGEDFYKYVAGQLAPVSASNDVYRCVGRPAGLGHPAGHMDFIVDVAGEEFNTYLEVNEPSTGIVQERPEFTNVYDENGNNQAGFFSARYSIKEEGAKLGTSGINGNSITELKSGQYTSQHGFVTQVEVATCPL